jgi:hypothetical protein
MPIERPECRARMKGWPKGVYCVLAKGHPPLLGTEGKNSPSHLPSRNLAPPKKIIYPKGDPRREQDD